MKEIFVKIDWLAYSVKGFEPEEVIAQWAPYFGQFTLCDYGYHCFKSSARAEGVTVMWNSPTEDAAGRVYVEITGTGTNILYRAGFDFEKFLRDSILDENIKLSRIDPCLDYFADDESDFFPYDKLLEKALDYSFVARFHRNSKSVRFVGAARGEDTYGIPATTLYLGSAASECKLTIYNKLRERLDKCEKGAPCDLPYIFEGDNYIKEWIRFEFRLRDKSANGFALLLFDNPLPTVFLGVLRNFINFVEDPEHIKNKGLRDVTVCDWWEELLSMSVKLKILRTSGEKSLQKVIAHVKRNMQPIACAVLAFGEEWLYEQIVEARQILKPKYQVALHACDIDYCSA